MKPAIPFIVILAVLQLLFYGDIASGGKVYLEYGFTVITSDSVRLVIVSALRFIEIIFVSSVLTLSTSTTQWTHGMESLLKPLKYVKFPVHEFSLIMTIAIRFVPTFAMEMEKMMKAQASRGGGIRDRILVADLSAHEGDVSDHRPAVSRGHGTGGGSDSGDGGEVLCAGW